MLEKDERLLKAFYLNKGYYDVEITSSTVNFLDNNSFNLTFRIDAGNKYIVNNASLELQ